VPIAPVAPGEVVSVIPVIEVDDRVEPERLRRARMLVEELLWPDEVVAFPDTEGWPFVMFASVALAPWRVIVCA
jgi:hypothetical protein